MKLLLPPSIVSQLATALAEAGPREIGGILMGEHVGIDTFRVKDLTIQKKGGAYATFVRLVEFFIAPLRAFFDATSHDYTRFNYVGEWHSHHAFALQPSGRDHATMREIIDDPKLGARFVTLMLVKLDNANRIQVSVTLYRPGRLPAAGEGILE